VPQRRALRRAQTDSKLNGAKRKSLPSHCIRGVAHG
jgi:hypothetical protein